MPTSSIPGRREDDMRIASLETSMREGFTRMESMLAGVDSRLRNVETQVVEFRSTQELRIQQLEKDNATQNAQICELQNFKDMANPLVLKIEALQTFKEKAEPVIDGVKWLAVVIGGLIVVLIWAILTHSITLVVP